MGVAGTNRLDVFTLYFKFIMIASNLILRYIKTLLRLIGGRLMKVSSCPACGGPVHPAAEQCPYCKQFLIADQETETTKNTDTFQGVLFQHCNEPNENAFSLAVPRGWVLEGGIQRANLTTRMVDAQSIEAKLNLTIKNDPEGRVMMRLCPEIKYCDMRYSMAGMMFPTGSNYTGMIVSPLMPAVDFIIRMVFPWAHPQAGQVQVLEQRGEPLLVDNYKRKMASLGVPTNFQYDGGIVTFEYSEGGMRFVEKAFSVIENMGPIAGGIWSNKDTVLVRAPVEEYELWEPVFQHIIESIELNLHWLAGEIVSQEFLARTFLNAQQAQQARERRMLEVQQQMQQIDRQIMDHRMHTNAEIMNDNYLNLMNLEEYVNPLTNELETGSNQWDYRWVNNNGDEFYTDHENDDPNIPGLLNATDWARTPVRPRFRSEANG
jgi:hypothetical protein